MIEALPDIPRLYTGLAEWSACVVYIMLMRKRLPGIALWSALAAGLTLLLALHTALDSLPLELWVVGMISAVALMYGLIYLTSSVSLREAGDLVLRAFVLAELVASLEWQLDVYFFGGTAPLSAPSVSLLLVIYGAVFVGAYTAERTHFPPDHHTPVDTRALVSVVGVAVVTFLMSNLSFLTSSTPFSSPLGPEVAYIRTLVDLCGFVILFAMRGQRIELLRAAEVDAVNVMLRNQHDRYLQSKHDIDTVNRKYHDLKHYIHAFRAEPNPELRATYIDQLEDSIRGYETSTLDTGNPVLDTILTAKTQQCERMGITLAAVADGTAVRFIDAMDLVSLVGNALDNAIEACARVERAEHRLIRLAVYRQDGFTMIKVENVFRGRLEIVDGLPRTTKAGALHHGYGLKNMRETTQAYGGTLTARAEGDWFAVRMLMPTPDADATVPAGADAEGEASEG